jgi:predicted methyltransferase
MSLKRTFVAVASLLVLATAAAAAAARIPANIAAAVANPDRPQEDRDRDANRKPDQDLAFAGVRPGWRVADVIPGTGYFSRVFSVAVGTKGRVYAFFPAELKNFLKITLPADGATPYAKFSNVQAIVAPVNAFSAPEPLDLVWISDNYHDLHDPFFAPADLAVINKQVFAALKPGGYYVVLDYVAPAGAGLSDTNTLHRIDPQSVKAEVEAAGFRFVGESDVLHNPDDPHTAPIFAQPLRGKVDQFIFKFQKPKV